MVKKLLWVLTVLSDWLEFSVEDIFHIAQSRTLYLCTFLASKIGLVAKIEFCLFLYLVDWTRVQAFDSNIRQCIEYLQANKKPHKKQTGHNPMIREYNRMKQINNILYRITTIEDEERQQLTMCTNGAL
jgi:hypothetical protein